MVTGLTLYNGSVIAEIVRAGINSLPRGQTEAAMAIGMRKNQLMRLILLPQAVTVMLPGDGVADGDRAEGHRAGLRSSATSKWCGPDSQLGAFFSNYLPSLLVVAAIMICSTVL